MRNYIIRRLLLLPVMMVGVSFFLFYLLQVQPGDAALLRIGVAGGACTDCLDNLREELGLDRPFIVQYLDWASHAARGDFGDSLGNDRPIAPEIKERLPNTLEIGLLTVLLTVLIGVPIGVISAIKPGTFIDYSLRFISIAGLSVPGFWIATLLVTLPAVWWKWTPLHTNFVRFTDDPIQNLQIMIWPALVLAISSSAYVARIVRSSMLETLYSDHVRTARAKGLRERVVVIRHVLRASLVTLLTVVGIQVGTILGGSVIIEQIFGIPGLGVMGLSAAFGQDYRIVLAVTMIFFTTFVLVQLAVDILYAYVDPRIRY